MPPKLFLDIASPRRGSPVGVTVDTGALREQGGVTVRCWLAAPAQEACAARAPRRTEQDVVRRRQSASQTTARSSWSAARSCTASRQRAWSATPAPAAGSPRRSSTRTRRAATVWGPRSGHLACCRKPAQCWCNEHVTERWCLVSRYRSETSGSCECWAEAPAAWCGPSALALSEPAKRPLTAWA